MNVNAKFVACALALFACAGIGTLLSADPPTAANIADDALDAQGDTPRPRDQGMVVVVDKDSGELRAPTAAEATRYVTPADNGAANVPGTQAVTRRADGSESMRLGERYTTYSTVHRNADGDWERVCRMDHDHRAAHAVHSPDANARAVQ